MLEFLQIALPYLPFFLLLPTILTSTLLLFLIAFGAPKFMKIYSVILAVYIIANLLTATTFAIIQPRLYLYNDGHLFSTRLSLSGSILFALPIHLLHFTILILLYILFVRFLALRGVLINQRAALISVFALYFTVPIGLLLAVSSVDTASIEVEGKTLNLFVMDSFWDCLFTEASIFLPIFWAVVSIILNFSANSIVFSREISLGYVHRVLICKKMAESIMYQILIVSLCISGSGWIVRIFPQFDRWTSFCLPISLSIFFALSPLHFVFTIRPFHEKLEKILGRRYSEDVGKSISITFDTSDSRNSSNSNPPIS